ncbi:MAG: DNA ligase D [Alphaproteobacteria bacterium]
MARGQSTGKGKSGRKSAATERGGLARYREKRDFQRTPEPPGTEPAGEGDLYIVQKHAARRLHYDLRLQLGGVLKSWAVAKGPSLDPKVKRLAVHVEDHPVDYGTFEGLIPKDEYGGGAVIVWDKGTWVPMSEPEEALEKGTLKFRLAGEKLGGGWSLVRLKGSGGAGRDWLLIKERDIFARPESEGDVLEEQPLSVLTGRSVEDIARESDTVRRRTGRRPAAPKPARIGGAVRRPLGKPPPPQLASSADAPPSGPGWVHEIKHDGYRTLCRLADGEARLFTRGGHDWTERYGPIAEALTRLRVKSAIIDGEICVQDARGLSSFPALQDALATGAAEKLVFFAFDLLYLDGYDLTDALLVDRKAALAALVEPVADETFPIQYSDHVVGHGAEFFAQAVEMSLEGIVSKKADAAYHPGRSKSWLKIKRMRSGEFLIVGYGETDAAGGVSALALAEPSGDELRYVGKVGTGFSAGEAARLRRKLTSLERRRPPMPLPRGMKPEDARWVRPKLLAEVEYTARTGEGSLRHAVYKGLREDVATPGATEAARPRRRYVSDADLAAVWVTNPGRVMFGKGGPTKLDLVLYHARVGDWMLPELLRRPLTLVRCPTGKVEDNFYQRHALAGMPPEIKGISMREEGSRERAAFLYIEDAKGLFFLAQFGVIEFHPWGCRVDKPERPDRLVFDLDPDERLDWLDVVEAALQIREELTALGFATFVRTTGGKGLHLVVPVERRHTWAGHKAFAHAFVQKMARRWPRRYTASPARHHREGRIFIDYIRNVRGATAVGSYSLRARPGAPVATPLDWSELRDVDDPAELNYATVPERLAGLARDPWQDIDRAARPITKEAQRKIAN